MRPHHVVVGVEDLNVDDHGDERQCGDGERSTDPAERDVERSEIGRRPVIGMDRRKEAQRRKVRGHRRSAVAQKGRHDAGERYDTQDTGRHHEHRHDQEECQRRAEEKTIVGRCVACDAEPAPGDDAVGGRKCEDSDDADLFTNRGEDEIRVSGRQVARIAQPDAGPERPASRQCPNGLSDLIAARNRVVPGRLPHEDSLGERPRHPGEVSDEEAGDEQRQPDDRHHEPAAGHRVHRQKDTAQEQRWAEIFLDRKQRQRHRDAGENGQHVFAARDVHPRGQPNAANGSTADAADELPSPREIPGEKEHEEEADGLDRLHRAEIDFRAAAAGSAAEQDQQRTQIDRTD